MRKLQYLRQCQQLSIQNDAVLEVVGPRLRILSYHGQRGINSICLVVALPDIDGYFARNAFPAEA